MSQNLFLIGHRLGLPSLFIIKRRKMSIFNQKPKEESIEARQQKHQEQEGENLEKLLGEKAATEKMEEFEIRQEQITKTGPSQQTKDLKKNSNQVLIDLKLDEKLKYAKSEPEPISETSEVPKKDMGWVKKVEEVIKKDKDKPYEEEEDAEVLQQDYLKKSFKEKVKIDE